MNNKGSSKTEAVVKLALIFFISLFSFSVGTFVGKQVSDSDRRRVALEAEYDHDRSIASVDKEEQKGVVSEKEIQDLTNEFVEAEQKQVEAREQEPIAEATEVMAQESTAEVKDAHSQVATHEVEMEDGYTKRAPVKKETASKAVTKMETKAAAKPEVASVAKTEVPEKVLNAIQRVAQGKSPTPNIVPKREPASVLPSISSTSIGKYTVQIASYATETEAKAYATKLKDEGFSAFYLSAKIGDKVWYRVSVGLFDSKNSANNFKNELMKQASISSAIVQKIIQ